MKKIIKSIRLLFELDSINKQLEELNADNEKLKWAIKNRLPYDLGYEFNKGRFKGFEIIDIFVVKEESIRFLISLYGQEMHKKFVYELHLKNRKNGAITTVLYHKEDKNFNL